MTGTPANPSAVPNRKARRKAEADLIAVGEAAPDIDTFNQAGISASSADAVAVVGELLGQYGAADIKCLDKVGPKAWAAGVAKMLRLRLNPRYMKTLPAGMVAAQVRKQSVGNAVALSELLHLPTINPITEESLGDSFDTPSESDIEALAAGLSNLGLTDLVVVTYLMTLVATEAPASPQILSVVEKLRLSQL